MGRQSIAQNGIPTRLPWVAKIVGWLLVQHLVWSVWLVLAFEGEARYLLFTLLQGVLLLGLGVYSWFNTSSVERNAPGG